MAYYDWHAEGAKKKNSESAKKFIESLPLKDSEGNIDFDSLNARDKFFELEEIIKSQKSKIEEYQKFFNTLKNLLPKDFTIHDKLI